MPDRISVKSLYGRHSHEGLVQIDMGKETAQLTVADAMHHARIVLEAANAAATDATLAWFLRDKLGAADEQVAGILADFRKWREANEPD
jgi:hypothetical protein